MKNLEYIYNELSNLKKAISVVGLGYVGFPIAKAFSEHFKVIAYDKSIERVEEIRENNQDNNLLVTYDYRKLKDAIFHIIAVPTPADDKCNPDFTPLVEASKIVGMNIIKGCIVVYESTVYPGATEEICVPVLEEYSNLKCGEDFFVAYSPERINPSDEIHTLKNISKIVAGMDIDTTNLVKKVYEMIVDNMVAVSSIRAAEAIKLIENCQRDVNIAFMNEVSILLNRMGIEPKEVFIGMDTKWNALRFRPGFVGGHCIAVDPYYLIDIASKYDVETAIISQARRINSYMAHYVGDQIVRKFSENGKILSCSQITVFGFTFKENCPDIRNTEVYNLIEFLKNSGIKVNVCDYVADAELVHQVYGVNLVDEETIARNDAIVLAVPHSRYRAWSVETIKQFLKDDEYCLVVDIKELFRKAQFEGLIDYISL